MAATAGRARWLIRGAAAQITTLRSLSSQALVQSDRIRSIHQLNPNLSFHNSNAQRFRFQLFDSKRFATSAMPSIDNYKQEHITSTKEDHFDEDLKTSRSKISGKEFEHDDNITKDDVISRVVDVIKCFPNVDHSKLIEEGHFDKDLGLDKDSWERIVWKLEKEFGIKYIPYEIETVKLVTGYIYETIRSPSSKNDDPTVDQINSTVSLVVKILDDVIKYRSSSYEKLNLSLYYKVLRLSSHVTEHYLSFTDKLRVFSAVLDRIQNYPQLGNSLVYQGRILIRTMSNDDGKDDISKDEVVSRVLEVVKNHPKIVDSSKVTAESHFKKDHLGFSDLDDEMSVLYALQYEFKLDLPVEEIDSCKDAIDYIYDNRMKRWSFKEFDDKLELIWTMM